MATLSLSDLNGTNGFRIVGIDAGDYSGFSVSSAGDVNGDGVDDVIIGAHGADPNGNLGAGESYLVFGSTDWNSAEVNLALLDGSNGFRIDGIDPGDMSGSIVSSVGDINGDGFSDIAVGAPGADPSNRVHAGETYIIFGADSWERSFLNLASLDGSNGFRIEGNSFASSGGAISAAGDVNGDGVDDVIIGASGAGGDTGESYVVFGSANWNAAYIDLYAIDGVNGFRIEGIDSNDRSGSSVSAAGDFNGDGVGDIIVGAYTADPNRNSSAGESYVIFGSAGWNAASISLSTLDGSNGFRIDGVDENDISGYSVSSAGDVNGDGFDDIIIGAPGGGPNGRVDSGESYIVFGSDSWNSSSVNLAELDGEMVFRINGVNTGDDSGRAVSAAGDVNGDGFADLLIGAHEADPNGLSSAGGTYVVYGSALNNFAFLDLSTLDGTNGFRIDGVAVDDRSGFAVSSAGDVNGDGLDDVIIGAYTADPNGNSSAGESYVVFGAATPSFVTLPTTLLDRFGQAVFDATVAMREIEGGAEVFVREVSEDTATGTVFEIVVQPSTDISALDFEFYDNAGLVDFQVSQALADWTTQTNSSVTDQVIFSGFGAPDNSQALPAGQETVVGRFETAPNVGFDLVGIFLNGESAQSISVQDKPLSSSLSNVTTHDIINGAQLQIAADKELEVAGENAIGAFDALQALRLAVGLTKSDGTAEWHDYFAADINQDGRVGADDALNILKFAVGLTDGPAADWVFVDGDADYSDVTRQNSGYSEGVFLDAVAADQSVELVGILLGDVDGSYL